MPMKIVNCANGHYYDESIYSKCPYCEASGNVFDDEVITVGDDYYLIADDFDYEGKTIGYDDFMDDEKTIAVNGLGTAEDIEKAGGTFNPVVGWLVCVKGPEKGRDFRIVSGRNYVGRSVDNNICIADDGSISRQRHFSIIYDPKSRRYFAVPGESESIQINGELKFTKHILQDGDIIACGDSEFCFIGFCKEGRDWT